MDKKGWVRNLEKTIPFLIVIFIITLLFIVGPTNALDLNLDFDNLEDILMGETIFLTLDVSILDIDPILDSITIEINGESCNFNFNATLLGNCSFVNLTKISNNLYGYGYGYGINQTLTYRIEVETCNFESGENQLTASIISSGEVLVSESLEINSYGIEEIFDNIESDAVICMLQSEEFLEDIPLNSEYKRPIQKLFYNCRRIEQGQLVIDRAIRYMEDGDLKDWEMKSITRSINKEIYFLEKTISYFEGSGMEEFDNLEVTINSLVEELEDLKLSLEYLETCFGYEEHGGVCRSSSKRNGLACVAIGRR